MADSSAPERPPSPSPSVRVVVVESPHKPRRLQIVHALRLRAPGSNDAGDASDRRQHQHYFTRSQAKQERFTASPDALTVSSEGAPRFSARWGSMKKAASGLGMADVLERADRKRFVRLRPASAGSHRAVETPQEGAAAAIPRLATLADENDVAAGREPSSTPTPELEAPKPKPDPRLVTQPSQAAHRYHGIAAAERHVNQLTQQVAERGSILDGIALIAKALDTALPYGRSNAPALPRPKSAHAARAKGQQSGEAHVHPDADTVSASTPMTASKVNAGQSPLVRPSSAGSRVRANPQRRQALPHATICVDTVSWALSPSGSDLPLARRNTAASFAERAAGTPLGRRLPAAPRPRPSSATSRRK